MLFLIKLHLKYIGTRHFLARCNCQALMRDENVPMGYLTAESIVTCSAESWSNVKGHLITDEKVPIIFKIFLRTRKKLQKIYEKFNISMLLNPLNFIMFHIITLNLRYTLSKVFINF